MTARETYRAAYRAFAESDFESTPAFLAFCAEGKALSRDEQLAIEAEVDADLAGALDFSAAVMGGGRTAAQIRRSA